jgi:hypothetical protein
MTEVAEEFSETKAEAALDAWIAKYKPIRGAQEGSAFTDEVDRFETFGEDRLRVGRTPEDRVWTLVSSDEGEYIAAGRHYVNRQACFICEVPYGDETPDDILYWHDSWMDV